MQWVGQRECITDFITRVTGNVVKNVDARSTFTNKAEDNAWAFVEAEDETQGQEIILTLPRSN
eukprot:7112473-Lingulodinium_polyedra.AAC.1